VVSPIRRSVLQPDNHAALIVLVPQDTSVAARKSDILYLHIIFGQSSHLEFLLFDLDTLHLLLSDRVQFGPNHVALFLHDDTFLRLQNLCRLYWYWLGSRFTFRCDLLDNICFFLGPLTKQSLLDTVALTTLAAAFDGAETHGGV